MDKMREEFEVWARKEGLPVEWLIDCEFYDARATEVSWQAWQASRAALVVTLPDSHNDWLDKQVVQHALDEAGVSYK